MRFAPLSLSLLFLGLVALLGACDVDVTSGETFICADADVTGAANQCAPGFTCFINIASGKGHCLPENTSVDCDSYRCFAEDMTMDLPMDAPSCPSPNMECGESCVDTDTNAMHCGACNQACDAGMACRDGACWCGVSGNCRSDQECCGDVCVPLGDTSCDCNGTHCQSGQRCCDDVCVTAIGDGCSLCTNCPATACVSSGQCNCDLVTCDAGPNIDSASCSESGGCDLICEDRFADCDADPINGCETDITSVENCAGCEIVCGATTAGCAPTGCDGVAGVLAGANATCVHTDSDRLVCWGTLGTGGSMEQWAQPVWLEQDVKHAAMYGHTLCFITTSNRIECRSPDDPDLINTARSWNNDTVMLDDITVGEGFFCVAGGVGTNRELYCGGADSKPLGVSNPMNNAINLVTVTDFVASGDNTMSAGEDHVCVIDQAGELVCWGDNRKRQVADTNSDRITLPTTVAAPSGFSGFFTMEKVAAGREFTCAKAAEDRTWCWGDNSQKQVTEMEVLVVSEPNIRFVDAGCTVVAMDAGDNHVCQLCDDGRMKCWGNNLSGKSSGDSQPSPFAPGYLSQFGGIGVQAHDMAAGRNHTCVSGGESVGVQCWGAGELYQLGLPNSSSTTTPTSVDTRPQPQ